MPRQTSGSCRARFPNASGRRGGTAAGRARWGGGGERPGPAGGGERRHRLRLRRPRDRRLLCAPSACCCFFQGLCLPLREKTRLCVALNNRDGGKIMTEPYPSPGHLSALGCGSFVYRAWGKSEVAAAPYAWGQTMVKPHRTSLTCTSFSTLALFWLLDYTHRVGRVSCRGCGVGVAGV